MTERKYYAVVEFEDGLQVIPDNWLNEDLTKAVWPTFTNNKRYYKAVKFMEEPLSTWLEHPICKIYGKFLNYAVARKKLKEAEALSDINSDTDRNESLKKSRKVRAAKIFDKDTSSDEQSDSSLISELPKVPEKRAITALKNNCIEKQTCTTKTKNATFSQTDVQNDTEDLLYASDTEQSFTKDFESANFTETASMPIQQAKLDSSFNCNQD
ncbi:uncharacterized protein LOC112638334 [Camponotus floridanus]|nr:uncharacterized protein LOC112638334 [Camponotus floridanus]